MRKECDIGRGQRQGAGRRYRALRLNPDFAHEKEYEVDVDRPITPEFLKNLADEYDIFINTSSGDANATTILENICFGFPVACTPETGFEYPSIIKLSTTDTAENIKKLTAMKNMSESELKKLVEENMKFVKKYYTWDNFLNEITKFMGLTD